MCIRDSAHLIHDQFQGEEDSIVKKCQEYGLQHIIVNGLEPKSNRDVIELCNKYHPILLPAIGIYPLDAACLTIQKNPSLWTASFEPPEPFNVDEEIDFIEEMAKQKKIIALGECGLDKYYLKDDETFAEQERVLRKLMRVAKKYDLPIILHTRKAEERVLELLLEEGTGYYYYYYYYYYYCYYYYYYYYYCYYYYYYCNYYYCYFIVTTTIAGVVKADFHCFCGKSALGVRIAENGYYLSIPSAVENNSQFQGLVKKLPLDKILTETDSPYMGPDKGARNDPSTVPRGVIAIAKAKNISVEECSLAIRQNFHTLFQI